MGFTLGAKAKAAPSGGKPLAQSKKKQRRIDDFKKVKLKLGAPPKQRNSFATLSNAGKLASKTLAVPVQGISLDKSHIAERTRSRNLTLPEILSALRHRCVAPRRDAVASLCEIITSHPHLLKTHLGAICMPLAQLATDPEAVVRSKLPATFELILSLLGKNSAHLLAPFAPLLLVYISSAMSHYLSDVQIDALRILNALLQSQIASYFRPYAPSVLPYFVSLIKTAGQSDSAASSSSMQLRLNLLCTLSHFMRLYNAHSHAGPELYATALPCTRMRAKIHSSAASSSYSPFSPLAEISTIALPGQITKSADSFSLHSADSVTSFIDSIAPFVTTIWLEHFSNVFASQKVRASESLSLCLASITLLSRLVSLPPLKSASFTPNTQWLRNFRKNIAEKFLREFPYAEGKEYDGSGTEEKLLQMNFAAIDIYRFAYASFISSGVTFGDTKIPSFLPYLESLFTMKSDTNTSPILTTENIKVLEQALITRSKYRSQLLANLISWASKINLRHQNKLRAIQITGNYVLAHISKASSEASLVLDFVRQMFALMQTKLESDQSHVMDLFKSSFSFLQSVLSAAPSSLVTKIMDSVAVSLQQFFPEGNDNSSTSDSCAHFGTLHLDLQNAVLALVYYVFRIPSSETSESCKKLLTLMCKFFLESSAKIVEAAALQVSDFLVYAGTKGNAIALLSALIVGIVPSEKANLTAEKSRALDVYHKERKLFIEGCYARLSDILCAERNSFSTECNEANISFLSFTEQSYVGADTENLWPNAVTEVLQRLQKLAKNNLSRFNELHKL